MLVVIIGLPGSGKTYMANIRYNDYVLFDDFIFEFYNGKVIEELKKGKNVCLTDPRLCNPIIFNRIMDQITQYIPKDLIQLILFENRPDKCKINKPNRSNTIDAMSVKYSLQNYDGWNAIQYPISIHP